MGSASTLDRRHAGFLLGMLATSVGLSSGFIWASQGRTLRVVVAAATAWVGYLGAHYAVTGRLLDSASRSGEGIGGREALDLEATWQYGAVVLGVSVLVSGMVVGAVYINRGDHLLTNVGGILFLGGYVIAHYGATRELL